MKSIAETAKEFRITNEEWAQYLVKYEGLLWKISHKISQDYAVADVDSNFADLVLAALESILGFHRLTGDNFEEMMKNIKFNQYTKTVLWNFKNKKGATITKNLAFSFHAVRLQLDHGDIIPCEKYMNFTENSLFIEELTSKFEGRLHTKCIKVINANPSLLTKEGKVNVDAVAREIGEASHKVRKALLEIKEFVKI